MRTLLALALLLTPSLARADAYAWGGRVEGLVVDVTLAGFRDGAGGGGWSEESARRFARRAPELRSMLGADARLEERVEDDEGLVLVLGARRIALDLHSFEGTDAQWDAVLASVRAHGLAVAHSRSARSVRIYTLELAGTFATLDEPPGQMFQEACLPCDGGRAVHTLGTRRVVGVFDGRAAAQRGLAWLRARGIRARVARL